MAEHMPCPGCLEASRRIQAKLTTMFFRDAMYGNHCEPTFAPVVSAAKHLLQRAEDILRGKPAAEHCCAGKPERCPSCGSPFILGRCLNIFCGAHIADQGWDRHLPRPGRAMDKVASTDHLVRRIKALRSHDGGESEWELLIYLTLDGEFYYTSPMLPTELTRDQILKLRSRHRSEVEPADLMLGETGAGAPDLLFGTDPLEDGTAWYTAYERPRTGERFRVYGFDRP